MRSNTSYEAQTRTRHRHADTTNDLKKKSYNSM